MQMETATLNWAWDHLNIIHSLENDLTKSRVEVIKLRSEIAELNNKIIANSNGENDTSSLFLLPSEFKDKWNSLITEMLMEVFSDFIDNPKEFVYIIHLSISAVKNAWLWEIQNKIDLAIDLFGIKNNSKNEFIIKIKKIMKDYWSYIFIHNDTFIEKVKLIIRETSEKSNKMTINSSNIDQLLDSCEFRKFVFLMYEIFIYMLLNDNQIEWDLSAFEHFKFQFESYNKDKHYWVDGFPKQGLPVIT